MCSVWTLGSLTPGRVLCRPISAVRRQTNVSIQKSRKSPENVKKIKNTPKSVKSVFFGVHFPYFTNFRNLRRNSVFFRTQVRNSVRVGRSAVYAPLLTVLLSTAPTPAYCPPVYPCLMPSGLLPPCLLSSSLLSSSILPTPLLTVLQ